MRHEAKVHFDRIFQLLDTVPQDSMESSQTREDSVCFHLFYTLVKKDDNTFVTIKQ
jgi:hypothetical protein